MSLESKKVNNMITCYRDQGSKDSVDDSKDVYFSGKQEVGHEESEETSAKGRDYGGHRGL